MTLKEIYTKYTKWIVIILLCLLTFKSCQSCSRNRTMQFNDLQYTEYIDSLNTVIDSLEMRNDSSLDSVNQYKIEVKNLNKLIDRYEKDNNHYKSMNKSLINTNKELSLNKQQE